MDSAVRESRYRLLVQAGGGYDLLVTLPFALPVVAGAHLELLAAVQAALGLGGAFPAFAPFHLFFLNLFGSIVSIWAVLRILHPEPPLGLADGVGRAVFAALMGYYLLAGDFPRIVAVFLVPEVVFGIAQLGGYRWYRRPRPAGVPLQLQRPVRGTHVATRQ